MSSAALAAQKASLMVEAAAMQEKEQLEPQMLKLQQQAKRLEINTDVKKIEAEQAALDEAEEDDAEDDEAEVEEQASSNDADSEVQLNYHRVAEWVQSTFYESEAAAQQPVVEQATSQRDVEPQSVAMQQAAATPQPAAAPPQPDSQSTPQPAAAAFLQPMRQPAAAFPQPAPEPAAAAFLQPKPQSAAGFLQPAAAYQPAGVFPQSAAAFQPPAAQPQPAAAYQPAAAFPQSAAEQIQMQSATTLPQPTSTQLHLNPATPEFQQSSHSAVRGGAIEEMIHILHMPKAEMMTFDGDPIKYWTFIKAFDNNIGKYNVDEHAKLARLLQYCKGRAYKVIDSCAAIETNGYA